MPRRSARLATRNEEQKDIEMETGDASTATTATKPNTHKTRAKSAKETANCDSVSNTPIADPHRDSNDAFKTTEIDIEIEEKEASRSVSVGSSVDVTDDVKRLSIDPNTVLPPMLTNTDTNDVAMEDIAEEPRRQSPNHNHQNPMDSDDEPISDHEAPTLAQTRVRRKNAKVSYKDESSDDDMASESDEDANDDNNPLFIGLTPEQRAELRHKMAGMQTQYTDSVRKERELKLQEIICSFDFNIGAKVTLEEAGFIYDFCTKHQFDVNDKIEDEGDFFLCSMREMMEEKVKLVRAGNHHHKKKKRKTNDDSDSEFDMNEYSDSDSEYEVDSDWDNPLVDNENMISEDEEFGPKKKRRRNKNVWRDKDGREYRAVGRLLLDDALKDTTNFEGWSGARVQAWKNKEVNPNAYYYRFNDPGEAQKNGSVREDEHKQFMERVMECGVNVHWGTFSMKVPGRVGYQCSNYWRQMMKDKWVKDPNYWIRSDGSFSFKRAKKGSVPDSVRKYSFVVLKDPSGVFDPLPAHHPKRPSDKQLAKYLQENVKQLTDKEKKGGKRGGKKGKGKKKEEEEETTNNKQKEETVKADKEEKESEEETTDNVEKKEKKKKSKKKKKKKKKKKTEDNEEEGAEEEGKKSKKSKKKKKKKKKDKSKKEKKSKKDRKKKKDKKGKKSKKKEAEGATEGENESNSVDNVRSNKRKRKSDGEVSEHEPPQKKRKLLKSAKKEDAENGDEVTTEEKEEDKVEASVLDDMVDIMTGEKIVNPAMSEYGHVMEYSSWCSILRNPRTKNQCPFTKQSVTRRSLIKLNADNIAEYKEKIVNITAADIETFKTTSS